MTMTIEQQKAIESGQPVRFAPPETPMERVLTRADLFDRVQSLIGTGDPEELYPMLADISPDDWEDASVYGIPPKS